MRLLDLFCGAGGAAMGYYRAGFTEIVGVDIKPQPRYPFAFVLGDALEYVAEHGHEFDAIHASPPCQAYSVSLNAHPAKRANHPDLVGVTRDALEKTGKPYVIENVIGAPLINYFVLCGEMFGLKVYRHRLFESNVFMMTPPHPYHPQKAIEVGRPVKEGDYMTVAGHFSGAEYAKKAMGIDWMGNKHELAEAIPPAYTEYIGKHLREHIERTRVE